MKSINIIYTCILLFSVFLCSCSENDRMLYDDTYAGISFEPAGFADNRSHTDSVSRNFKFKPSDYILDTVSITVRVLGGERDYDRYFKVKINEEEEVKNRAVEGVHFETLLDKYVVPANKSFAKIDIVLKRHQDLSERTFVLPLTFEETPDFKHGMDAYQKFKIRLNDSFLDPPYFWRTMARYNFYGYPYEPLVVEKYVEIAGITEETWRTEYTNYAIYANFVKKWFNENPTIGSDGKIIKF